MTPREQLGGAVLAALPWVIAAVGALLTVLSAWVTARLATGRKQAQLLAAQNHRHLRS